MRRNAQRDWENAAPPREEGDGAAKADPEVLNRPCRCDVDRDYAISIRAADASVSKPPKAMKILPIREVCVHVESLLLTVAVGAAAGGVLIDAIAMLGVGCLLLSLSDRSTSLSSSGGTTLALAAVCGGEGDASLRVVAGAGTSVDAAPTVAVEESNCALALATDDDSVAEVPSSFVAGLGWAATF